MTEKIKCGSYLVPLAFVRWVENRTGLPIGWQSDDSIERLHGIWLNLEPREAYRR